MRAVLAELRLFGPVVVQPGSCRIEVTAAELELANGSIGAVCCDEVGSELSLPNAEEDSSDSTSSSLERASESVSGATSWDTACRRCGRGDGAKCLQGTCRRRWATCILVASAAALFGFGDAVREKLTGRSALVIPDEPAQALLLPLQACLIWFTETAGLTE